MKLAGLKQRRSASFFIKKHGLPVSVSCCLNQSKTMSVLFIFLTESWTGSMFIVTNLRYIVSLIETEEDGAR
jgi:uncharacterized membrane protein